MDYLRSRQILQSHQRFKLQHKSDKTLSKQILRPKDDPHYRKMTWSSLGHLEIGKVTVFVSSKSMTGFLTEIVSWQISTCNLALHKQEKIRVSHLTFKFKFNRHKLQTALEEKWNDFTAIWTLALTGMSASIYSLDMSRKSKKKVDTWISKKINVKLECK